MRKEGISIITVVLNDARGLKSTIDSIKDQEGISIEHIIVDGGSTDGSAVLAEQFSDVYIESRSDGGIYQGMQRGALAATNPVIMFVNSGDQIEGNRNLKEAVRHLMHSNCDWGFGPILEHTLRSTLKQSDSSGALTLEAISKRKTYIPFPVVLIKRDLFIRLGGFSFNYKIAGDFELIVRLAKHAKPTRWDFAIVRFAAGGISYTQPITAWNEEHLIRKDILHLSGLKNFISYSVTLRRILRWKVGKILDKLQQTGFLGYKHWRDRI